MRLFSYHALMKSAITLILEVQYILVITFLNEIRF